MCELRRKKMKIPTWLNTSEYPFQSHWFSVGKHRMHYLDEGKGDCILFVHGTPSWSFDFRNIIKSLRNHYRCIAADHIGFGLSDKPADYDYTIQQHCNTLQNFILEKQLKDITLVVHDFGGPIGLHFAIKHPERIKRIVILNSWMWSSEGEKDYLKLKKVLRSPVLPFLYKYFNFSARFILPKSFGNNKLPVALRAQYTRPFNNCRERYGTIAFAQSLLNDQQWFESLWQSKETIAQKPVLFIWGMKDPVIRPHYLAKFQSGFPRSISLELHGCGHFPQEEQPVEVSDAIQKFITDNP